MPACRLSWPVYAENALAGLRRKRPRSAGLFMPETKWPDYAGRWQRYEASLAERRYAACDPENRLIIAQLEKSWETALQRVQALENRLHAADASAAPVRCRIRAVRTRPGSRGCVECAVGEHTCASATDANADRRCRCGRRWGIARDRRNGPLARRSAFAATGAKASLRRARMQHSRTGHRRYPQHGDALVW